MEVFSIDSKNLPILSSNSDVSSHGILSSQAGRVEPGPDLALVMS